MTAPFIMVAPNGARRGKADHPALPVTLEDTLATARACFDAGAQALHLHVRDAEGQHSLDAGRYREALAEMARALPDMAVQITTESAGRFSVAEQLACLDAVRPAWASVALREMAREPDLARRFYAVAAETGTRLQHIVFGPEDVPLLHRFQADGSLAPGPVEAILVLGRYTDGPPSDPAGVAPFADHLPERTGWMLCAFGPAEHACLQEAARLGGTCRVGFENSLTAPDGAPWTDNAASVRALRAALAAEE